MSKHSFLRAVFCSLVAFLALCAARTARAQFTGACCSDGGSCSVVAAPLCQGTFLGVSSTCSPGRCLGKCCLPSSCTVTSLGGCELAGGVFGGFGTICTGGCPAFGACCTSSLNCAYTIATNCTAGVFVTGSTCSPNPCPSRTEFQGACCLVTGACELRTRSACSNDYRGDNTTCTPMPCPRACCMPSGVCSVLRESECAQSGGQFFAASHTCQYNMCPRPCCNVSGACSLAYSCPYPNTNVIMCGPEPCATLGRCCLTNGGCIQVTSDGCSYRADEIGWTAGAACSPGTPCLGACCRFAGTCVLTARANCNGTHDYFNGEGSVCGTPCTPVGACCSHGAAYVCTVTWDFQCPTQGQPSSTFHQGQTCSVALCTVACCTGNGPCVYTTEYQCEGAFGTYLGESLGNVSCGPPCSTALAGACCRGQGCTVAYSEEKCPVTQGAFFLGVGTTCTPATCVYGGCCVSSGVCTQLPFAVCTGTYLGAGSTCTPNLCPQPGACCDLAGACTLTQGADCLGLFLGNATACSPNPCSPFGACCDQAGTCTSVMSGQCSGVFQGAGTACTPNPCQQPGACCAATGLCTLAVQSACSGGFQGAGSACTPNPCPQPGACCQSTGACTFGLASACAGTFAGAGIACASAACPQPGACCGQAGDCTITLSNACSWVFVSNQTSCTPDPCIQTGACCDPNDACTLVPGAQCNAIYMGDGTVCAPNACEQTGACCGALGACALTTPATCTGIYMGILSTCSPNPCPQPAGRVVIAQFYGQGGLAGASYRNDFVVLLNRSTQGVDLNGWSLQYATSTATSWSRVILATAPTVLNPGQYFLVGLGSQGSNGAVLPTTDASSPGTNINGFGGKLALMRTSTQITGVACPRTDPNWQADMEDFVGYGTSANCFEGTGRANGNSTFNTESSARMNDGCKDTDDNLSDFQLATTLPLNTSSPTLDCSVQVAGACCFAGLQCLNMTVGDCANAGGVFGGAGTMCTPQSTCPLGACCTSQGECEVIEESQCTGVFVQALTCAPSPCLGVCCDANGQCFSSTADICNGLFFAQGACSPSPCLGACCQSSGSGLCALTTQGVCESANGVFLLAQSCVPGGQDELCPLGACCNTATGACEITSESACSHTFVGFGSVCDVNTCPMPTGACCFALSNCGIYERATCFFNGGLYAGNNTTCGPNDECLAGACCDAGGGCAIVANQAACTGGFIIAELCSPSPCTGACCDANGQCSIIGAAACVGMHYTPNGLCSPSPCLGACCTSVGGLCGVTTEGPCVGGNGIFMLARTCVPSGQQQLCPLGACCDTATGECVLTLESGCTHTFLGAGALCDLNTCPMPTGACCLALSNCGIYERAACLSINGLYAGNGTTCGPNDDCLAGACCDTSGNCSVTVNQATCTGGFILASLCSPSPCTGACCDANGQCSVIGAAACAGMHYVPGGSCDPSPCLGACCVPGGYFCATVTQLECSNANGQFHLGRSCVPSGQDLLCPLGACCDTATGACSVVFQSSCQFTFVGPGVACDANNCPEPSGACCLDANSCAVLAVLTCQQQNGYYGGNESLCGPNGECITGACCSAGGVCTVGTSAQCAATFVPGVSCTPLPCTGACCSSTGGCTVTSPSECSFAYLPGQTCDPVPCIGACCVGGGACTVATPSQCQTLSGVLYPNFSACIGTQCPYGACCEALTGACTLAPQAACAGSFQGLSTVCNPSPCGDPTGACCAASVCSIMTEADCQVASGTYLGNAVACTAQNDCPTIGCCDSNGVCTLVFPGTCTGTTIASATCTPQSCTGACCTEGGGCVIVPVQSCAGTYLPVGACSPNPCAGACCTGAGACSVTNQETCQQQGGLYFGITASCSAALCPVGACCDVNTGCTLTLAAGCPGGFQGVGTICTPSACDATGACCQESGVCTIATATTCSGTFQGSGIACTPSTCPQVGACCSGTNCTIADGTACSGAFLGGGSTCSANPCDLAGACCVGQACAVGVESACTGTYVGAGTGCAPDPCAMPPANDECAGATPIVLGSNPGTNANATTSVGISPPTVCGALDGGTRDVFYTFVPSATGMYRLEHCATSLGGEAVLAVYDACPVSNATTPVSGGCDDGSSRPACASGFAHTLISGVLLNLGQTYYIRRASAGTGTADAPIEVTLIEAIGACCTAGACTLELASACAGVHQGAGTACVPNTCPMPPENDECAGAIPITIGSNSGSNLNASTSFTITPPAICGSASGGSSDVFYSFVPTISGTYQFDHCALSASGTAHLALYLGCPAGGSVSPLTCGASSGINGCSSGFGRTTLDPVVLTAGTTYYLRRASDSSGPSEGPIVVTLSDPSGACCVAGGACIIQPLSLCPGFFQGAGVPCTPNPCPQPLGACCLPSGSCVQANALTCLGSFQGADTICEPETCPPPALGACCTPLGNCLLLPNHLCAFSFTAGGTCTPNPCALITAACCTSSGCSLTTATTCVDGVFLPNTPTCTPSPCVTGACCLHGNCTVSLSTTCLGAFAGPGTTCIPTPCTRIGACCRDLACTIESEASCNGPTDLWLGVFSSCAPNPCNRVGACCEAPQSICYQATHCGFVFFGQGTVCSPVLECRTYGACCRTFGTAVCTVVESGQCTPHLGRYLGDGSTCTPTGCHGVCCVSGTCSSTDRVSCAATSQAVFIADPTASCALNLCPSPLGVCCKGATCMITTQAACVGTATVSATFILGGIACNPPGNRTTPCCFADFNGGGVTLQDLFDFLNAWFAGNSNAQTGGDGSSPPSLQSIFDYLNAWFAGGCS